MGNQNAVSGIQIERLLIPDHNRQRIIYGNDQVIEFRCFQIHPRGLLNNSEPVHKCINGQVVMPYLYLQGEGFTGFDAESRNPAGIQSIIRCGFSLFFVL